MRRLWLMTVLSGITLAACGGDAGSNATPSSTADTPAPSASAQATSQAPAARELQLTDADNGTTVRLARDGRLIIALQSNPSTGFSWYVGAMAGPELQLSGKPVYAPPGSTAPVAGAPGTQVFTFVTTGIGMPPAGTRAVVQMVLEYRRSFEPDVPAAKTFNLTVEIN